MNVFKCNECDKIFTTKQNMDYHIGRRVCQKPKENICQYCDKEFAHKSGLYRHRKDCKYKADNSFGDEVNINNSQRDEMAKIYKLLAKMKEENEQLKVKVTKMEKGSIENITNNNYTNSNINNGTINNIYLVGYGKEDMNKIDRSDLLKVFGTGFNSPLSLTETMHFNPKYPEFHNVYIPSMKDKYAMIYDGSEWTMVTKEYLIDKIYDNKRDYIEENLEDFLDSLSNSQQKALQRWMKAEEDHPYIVKIKDDIKLLMYNKRKMPISNKKCCNITSYEQDNIDMIDVVNKKVYVSSKNDISNNMSNRIIIVQNNNERKIEKPIKFSSSAPRKGSKRKVI